MAVNNKDLNTLDINTLEKYMNWYVLSNLGLFILFFIAWYIYQHYKIPLFCFGISFLLSLLFYIFTKIYLQKLGINRIRDLVNVEILNQFPKYKRQFYLSGVPICGGMMLPLYVFPPLIIGLSNFFPTLGGKLFIIFGVLYLFIFLNSIRIRGIIIEAPKKMKRYENISYKIPLTIIFKSFAKICAFILAVGLIGILIEAILYPIFTWRTWIIVTHTMIILLVFPLFFKLRNLLFSPILSWVKENVRCPKCKGKIRRVNVGISEFSLVRLIITCGECQKKFHLETGFWGRTLYFYRK